MKRFRVTSSGYKFDAFYIYGAWLVVLIYIVSIGIIFKMDFSYHPSFECKQDFCKNPLVEGKVGCRTMVGLPCKINCQEEWCTTPLLPRGVYGRPPFDLNTVTPIVILLSIAAALFLNHISYNSGKKFDLGLDTLQLGKIIKHFKEAKDEENKNKGPDNNRK